MGAFAKVLLAIAILVANGVLLFVILRFLLWLAFPGNRDEEAAVAGARPAVGATTAAGGATSATASAAVAAQAPELLTPSPTPGMPILTATSIGRSRAYPHRLLIGLPVILALFAGGVWLGSVVGGSGAAAAATHTIHVTGTVVTVNSRTVVRVPATNVKVKGSIVSVPETTVRLPSRVVTRVVKRTLTTTRTLPSKTVTTATTVVIPTTITGPTTTATITVTDTGTSGTSTTSTSATT